MKADVVRAQDMATPESARAVVSSIVNVSGHGEVNVPPDTASVAIGVDVTQPTLTEAQAQATAQATDVIAALKAAGIASEDIQTVFYNVDILRDNSKHGDPTKITGYEITNQLQVTRARHRDPGSVARYGGQGGRQQRQRRDVLRR